LAHGSLVGTPRLPDLGRDPESLANHSGLERVTFKKLGLQISASPIDRFSVTQPEPKGFQPLEWLLLEVDHAEQAVRVPVRARGKEKLVGLAAHSTSTKGQSPQPVDLDNLVGCILKLTHELSAAGVERVDAAIAEVSYQQGVASRTKVLGRQG
jgi:hypothetical protein